MWIKGLGPGDARYRRNLNVSRDFGLAISVASDGPSVVGRGPPDVNMASLGYEVGVREKEQLLYCSMADVSRLKINRVLEFSYLVRYCLLSCSRFMDQGGSLEDKMIPLLK